MAMQSPAVFPLLNAAGEDFSVVTPGTQIGELAGDLEGVDSLSIWGQLSAAAASSGAGVTAYIQTSFAGAAWYDIACIAFGSETVAMVANIVSQAAAPVEVTDQAMADNTVLNGPIGDRLRAVVVVDGDFDAPSILALRAHAR